MATVTKNTVEKEVVVKQVFTDSITLTLSPLEALVLANIFGAIGGASDGPRQVTDDILRKLKLLGFDWTEPHTLVHTGEIVFHDKSLTLIKNHLQELQPRIGLCQE